jgi:hypothetical protein
MLDKREFDRQMDKFETQYSSQYGEMRRNLIYSFMNKATPHQLANAMLEALMRFNYENMPEGKHLVSILYFLYPSTVKHRMEHEFNLRCISGGNEQEAV